MSKETEAGCGAVGAPVEALVMQHTPGPWRAAREKNVRDDMCNGVIAECNDLWVAACYRSGTTAANERSAEAEAEAEANARLIASAPELLAALKALDECYCEVHDEMSRAQRAHHRQVLIKARAAVAKAVGAA